MEPLRKIIALLITSGLVACGGGGGGEAPVYSPSSYHEEPAGEISHGVVSKEIDTRATSRFGIDVTVRPEGANGRIGGIDIVMGIDTRMVIPHDPVTGEVYSGVFAYDGPAPPNCVIARIQQWTAGDGTVLRQEMHLAALYLSGNGFGADSGHLLTVKFTVPPGVERARVTVLKSQIANDTGTGYFSDPDVSIR